MRLHCLYLLLAPYFFFPINVVQNSEILIFCRWGELKVAKRFIEDYRVNPICEDKAGMTPLHWSCTHEK